MVSYVEFDKILTELQTKYERHFISILQALNLKYIQWKNLFQNILKDQWWLINKTITNHARKEISLNQRGWSWKRPIVFIKDESSIWCLHPEVPRGLQAWWLHCQSASYPLAIRANLTWWSSSSQSRSIPHGTSIHSCPLPSLQSSNWNVKTFGDFIESWLFPSSQSANLGWSALEQFWLIHVAADTKW